MTYRPKWWDWITGTLLGIWGRLTNMLYGPDGKWWMLIGTPIGGAVILFFGVHTLMNGLGSLVGTIETIMARNGTEGIGAFLAYTSIGGVYPYNIYWLINQFFPMNVYIGVIGSVWVAELICAGIATFKDIAARTVSVGRKR